MQNEKLQLKIKNNSIVLDFELSFYTFRFKL